MKRIFVALVFSLLVLNALTACAAGKVGTMSIGDPITPDPPMTMGNSCADLTSEDYLNVVPACGQFWKLSEVSIISGNSVTFPAPLHLIVQESGVVIRHSVYNTLSQLEASEGVLPLGDGIKITINLMNRLVQLGYETCDHVWLYFEGYGKATGGGFTACSNVSAYPDPLGCYSLTCPAPLEGHSL
jgi:hypothetical protein